MRWLAKSDAVAVSDDGASCSHECNSWDTACGDTWFSEGIVSIELHTDEVDRPSLYAGIVSRDHSFEEDTALRDSPHALCMHGDGRVFIRTLEKDWGLMRMESGSSVRFILDFNTKSLKIVLARTIRGKAKETIAEVPGLFAEATLAVCFGGKGQRVTIGEVTVDTSGGDASAPVARDVFVEAMGQPVAPLTLAAERGDAEASAAAEVAKVAATMG